MSAHLKLWLCLAAALQVSGQTPAPSPQQPAAAPQASIAEVMHRAAAQQAAAVASQLSQSVARQRASIAIQVQAQAAAPEEFFMLSAPRIEIPAPFPGQNAAASCDPLPPEQADPLIEEAARSQGLSAGLLRAVAQQESGLRPCAVSPKGAMGVMQLMPDTAAGLGVLNPFDAKSSIDSGARLLKELLTRYGGDVALALGAYNAGSSRVDQLGAVPDFPETQHYVREILGKLP